MSLHELLRAPNGLPSSGRDADQAPGPHPLKQSEFRLTGRHVLFGFIGFFGLILAVNLVFVTVALDTFTGLTDRHSYRTGISWNQKLDEASALRELGWHVALEPEIAPSMHSDSATVTAGRHLTLTVTLTDAEGAPVQAGALVGSARHPIVQGLDRTLVVEPLGAGRYRLDGELPTVGDWTIRISIQRAEGAAYRLDRVVRVR